MTKNSLLSKCVMLLIVGIVILPEITKAQLIIKGPVCAVPGLSYQYVISGNWGSVSSLQICISGGTINNTTDSCLQVTPISFFKVEWDSGSTGAIHLKAGIYDIVKNIQITKLLAAGIIDSIDNFQLIGYDSVPNHIDCSNPSGGNCSPGYKYQWQQSLDDVHWMDISGATGKNLNFSVPIVQTTFYRRKVIETHSGSIAYSLSATVFVKAPPANTGQ